MELTLWTYEGPPHVGAMRIAASMQGVHYVLHAPQGDTYADLLFTMIERRDQRPPVTYTTFQARDLGGDTAELVKRSIRDAADRFQPQALLVGESCTAELIQDQPGALAQGMNLPMPVVTLELPAYSKKENWGAAETLYQLIRTLLKPQLPPAGLTKPDPKRWHEQGRRPRVTCRGSRSFCWPRAARRALPRHCVFSCGPWGLERPSWLPPLPACSHSSRPMASQGGCR